MSPGIDTIFPTEANSPFHKAQWIDHPSPESPNTYFAFRTTIQLASVDSGPYRLRIAADAGYQLFVNGRAVGRGALPSGFEWFYYDEFDVGPHLREGVNHIAILHFFAGISTFSNTCKRRGLICELTHASGKSSRIIAATNATWRVQPMTAWSAEPSKASHQLGLVETQDHSKGNPLGIVANPKARPIGAKARIIPADDMPTTHWVRRPIPAMTDDICDDPRLIKIGTLSGKSVDDIPAKAMTRDEIRWDRSQLKALGSKACGDIALPAGKHTGSALLYDFEKVMIGYPRVEITLTKPAVVDVGMGETLIKGRIKPYRVVRRVHVVSNHAHRFILPAGRHVIEPAFHRSGLRYLGVHVRTKSEATVHSVAVRDQRYPVKAAGAFSCDDPLLNRIFELSQETLSACMIETYVDCPHREQAQWWGDARIQALCNYYTFGDQALVAKGLREMAASQREEDGLLLCIYPSGYKRIIPYSSLAWILSLHDYVMYTGDTATARALWPTLQRLLKGYASYASDVLLDGFDLQGIWNFFEWGPMANEGKQMALNSLYAYGLDVAADLEKLLSRRRDGAQWRQLAEKVRTEIRKTLWDPRHKCFVDGTRDGQRNGSISEVANIVALALNTCNDKQAKAVARRFRDGPGESVPLTSTYGEFYRLLAMEHHWPNPSEAIQEQIRSKWGGAIRSEAVTVPELFLLVAKSMKAAEMSMCHAWGSHPTYWLSGFVLGLRPTAPGWKEFSFAPRPGELRQMNGKVPTPLGVISARCDRQGAGYRVEIEVPPGTSCQADLSHLGKAALIHNGRKAALRKKSLRLNEGKHVLVLS
jgi:alpha-L-rhamnosidase